MEWYWALTLLIGSLIGFMAVGMPVVFAFFAVDIIGAFIFMRGEIGILQFVRNSVDSLQVFALMPIPMFVFMGEMLLHSGVASRAIGAVDLLIARLPGRLSLVAIAGGTFFSSLSGSSIANTAMLGSTLLPDMYKRGYRPDIAIGPIVAVGGIAILIPPSALGVLLGSLAQISISKLLVAAIIPALIMAVLFFGYVMVRCILQPDIAPGYEMQPISLIERLKPFLIYVVPLLLIFLMVVCSILFGLATPTESASVGAISTVLACILYRAFSWKIFADALRETVKISVMTLFIIAGSVTFSQILAFSGASSGLSSLVLSGDLTPLAIIIGMLAILFFLGCFMDQVSMMLITIPLYMPIVSQLGFDPVWFGVLMLIVLEISLATPPFGLLLFVMKGVAPPGTTLEQIILSVLPFILLSLLVVAMIIIWPSLATFLPEIMESMR